MEVNNILDEEEDGEDDDDKDEDGNTEENNACGKIHCVDWGVFSWNWVLCGDEKNLIKTETQTTLM